MHFKLVIDANAGIAETPVWDKRKNGLFWTDVSTGDIHFYTPKHDKEIVYHTGKAIGSAIPCDDPDRLFCALDGGLFLYNLTSGELELICNPDERPDYRYNDSRIDAMGRIITSSVSKNYGSASYSPDMKGNFYVVDTDGSISIIEGGINQFNGIVWNTNNSKMFVVDTFNNLLLVYPYDINKGPTGSRTEEVDLSALGMPDGISIDEEENLYICHWTGKISVWNKELNLKKVISFPVEYVACGGFGGIDMKDFYVATASFNYTDEDFKNNPGAGGLFVASSEVAGRPDHFYRIR